MIYKLLIFNKLDNRFLGADCPPLSAKSSQLIIVVEFERLLVNFGTVSGQFFIRLFELG